MVGQLLHIADRVINRPLLLHPTKAELMLGLFDGRLGGPEVVVRERSEIPDASRFIGTKDRTTRKGRALTRADNGVALLSVVGGLVNRGMWVGEDWSTGLTSYEGIGAQVREIAADDEIHSVVVDVESPGGEAAGMETVASQVRQLAKTKRVIAVVNDMAASAGFGVISGADEIVISPTSMVGSIGVVLLHLDRSEQYHKAGIKPTLIFAGAHKVDGNPFGPLPDTVADDLKREVMLFYDRFVETVAAGRGKRLTAEMARATEARVFIGEEAVKAGLADRVGTLDEVLAELQSRDRRGGAKQSGGKAAMKTENEDTVARADHDKAVADARAEGRKEGLAEGEKAGVEKGVKQERDRVSGILSSEEAKGREPQATALIQTDASVDQAKAVLAASPKTGIDPAAALAARVASTGQDLKAIDKNPGPGIDSKALWQKSVDQYNGRTASR